MLFHQWLDKWLQVYKFGNVKDNTYNNYNYALQLVKANFENHPLTEISEIDIQQLLQKLHKQGYSKSTIRLVKMTLTQAFRRAIKLHYMADNPAEDTKVPIMASEKIVDAFSPADQQRILAAAQSDLHGELIIFLLNTGLRKSELLNLRWENYGSCIVSGKTVSYIKIIKSKTKKGTRIVPLTSDAVKIIERQPRINDYIFNSTKGTPVTKSVLRRVCERLKRETGVSITPHMCRHTFATRLYEEDVDVKSLSELLGHSKVSFTIQRYVTPNLQKQMQVISCLEKVYHKTDV